MCSLLRGCFNRGDSLEFQIGVEKFHFRCSAEYYRLRPVRPVPKEQCQGITSKRACNRFVYSLETFQHNTPSVAAGLSVHRINSPFEFLPFLRPFNERDEVVIEV